MDKLTDVEKDKVMAFNEDPVLVNAIRKILLAVIYDNGTIRKDVEPDPTRNGALGLVALACSGKGTISDEELGQDLRGLFQGVQLLEMGLNELAKIKREVKGVEESPYNEAE